MTPKARPAQIANWEKEDAPPPPRRHIVVAAVVYLVWLGFLAVLAAQRWLGVLQ